MRVLNVHSKLLSKKNILVFRCQGRCLRKNLILQKETSSFTDFTVLRNQDEDDHTDLCFFAAVSTKMETSITWSSGETCPTTSARGRWMILTFPITTAIKLLTGTTGQWTVPSLDRAYNQPVLWWGGLSPPTASVTRQRADIRGGPTPSSGDERQEAWRGPSKEGGPSWCSHHWRE